MLLRPQGGGIAAILLMSKKFVVTSRETHRNVWGHFELFRFASGEWACINLTEHIWKYTLEPEDEGDEAFHLEGSFVVEDGTVIDYDGCVELPRVVISALRRCGYKRAL